MRGNFEAVKHCSCWNAMRGVVKVWVNLCGELSRKVESRQFGLAAAVVHAHAL